MTGLFAPGKSLPLTGYEIHMGETTRGQHTRPFTVITSRNKQALQFEDGAINEQGSAAGTYIHGLFDNADFTRTLLNQLRAGKGIAPLPLSQFSYQLYKEQQFDILADAMRQHIDIEEIYKIMQQQQQNRSAV